MISLKHFDFLEKRRMEFLKKKYPTQNRIRIFFRKKASAVRRFFYFRKQFFALRVNKVRRIIRSIFVFLIPQALRKRYLEWKDTFDFWASFRRFKSNRYYEYLVFKNYLLLWIRFPLFYARTLIRALYLGITDPIKDFIKEESAKASQLRRIRQEEQWKKELLDYDPEKEARLPIEIRAFFKNLLIDTFLYQPFFFRVNELYYIYIYSKWLEIYTNFSVLAYRVLNNRFLAPLWFVVTFFVPVFALSYCFFMAYAGFFISHLFLYGLFYTYIAWVPVHIIFLYWISTFPWILYEHNYFDLFDMDEENNISFISDWRIPLFGRTYTGWWKIFPLGNAVLKAFTGREDEGRDERTHLNVWPVNKFEGDDIRSYRSYFFYDYWHFRWKMQQLGNRFQTRVLEGRKHGWIAEPEEDDQDDQNYWFTADTRARADLMYIYEMEENYYWGNLEEDESDPDGFSPDIFEDVESWVSPFETISRFYNQYDEKVSNKLLLPHDNFLDPSISTFLTPYKFDPNMKREIVRVLKREEAKLPRRSKTSFFGKKNLHQDFFGNEVFLDNLVLAPLEIFQTGLNSSFSSNLSLIERENLLGYDKSDEDSSLRSFYLPPLVYGTNFGDLFLNSKKLQKPSLLLPFSSLAYFRGPEFHYRRKHFFNSKRMGANFFYLNHFSGRGKYGFRSKVELTRTILLATVFNFFKRRDNFSPNKRKFKKIDEKANDLFALLVSNVSKQAHYPWVSYKYALQQKPLFYMCYPLISALTLKGRRRWKPIFKRYDSSISTHQSNPTYVTRLKRDFREIYSNSSYE